MKKDLKPQEKKGLLKAVSSALLECSKVLQGSTGKRATIIGAILGAVGTAIYYICA